MRVAIFLKFGLKVGAACGVMVDIVAIVGPTVRGLTTAPTVVVAVAIGSPDVSVGTVVLVTTVVTIEEVNETVAGALLQPKIKTSKNTIGKRNFLFKIPST